MATKKATSTKKKSSTTRTAKAPATRETTNVTRVTTSSAAAVASRNNVIAETLRTTGYWRALGLEFFGVFLLAAVVLTTQESPIYVFFALLAIVLFAGTAAGAHLNPAVTVGAWVSRRINWLSAVGLIVAQFVGAALALVIVNAFIGGSGPVDQQSQLLGQTAPQIFQAAALPDGKQWFVFFAELLGATVFAYGVAHALKESRNRIVSALSISGGAFIGLLLAITMASYVNATAVANPAVALSLQGLDWNVWALAVYILAPVIGGVLGFLLHDVLRGRSGVNA
ncbi:MAG: rane protein of unknown function [Candidatus Saccharibacteria bacterium]|nr:rane protein of unknown function [Candidatus Saccharibacteria bacterium]